MINTIENTPQLLYIRVMLLDILGAKTRISEMIELYLARKLQNGKPKIENQYLRKPKTI